MSKNRETDHNAKQTVYTPVSWGLWHAWKQESQYIHRYTQASYVSYLKWNIGTSPYSLLFVSGYVHTATVIVSNVVHFVQNIYEKVLKKTISIEIV